jgi:feruloyl esterase
VTGTVDGTIGFEVRRPEAQRYPHDYDGIVAGAPANHPMAMWPGEIYPAVLARSLDIPALVGKLPAVEAAAIAQCDALDGASDGLIGDPRACDFDAASVPELTEDEARAVNLIYEGLKHPATGEPVWPGFEPGSESQWAGHLKLSVLVKGRFRSMFGRP